METATPPLPTRATTHHQGNQTVNTVVMPLTRPGPTCIRIVEPTIGHTPSGSHGIPTQACRQIRHLDSCMVCPDTVQPDTHAQPVYRARCTRSTPRSPPPPGIGNPYRALSPRPQNPFTELLDAPDRGSSLHVVTIFTVQSAECVSCRDKINN